MPARAHPVVVIPACLGAVAVEVDADRPAPTAPRTTALVRERREVGLVDGTRGRHRRSSTTGRIDRPSVSLATRTRPWGRESTHSVEPHRLWGRMEAAVLDACAFLFGAFFAYLPYAAAKGVAARSTCPRWKAYGWAIGFSAFMAFNSWAKYGTHTEDADPIYGGGEVVVDFRPTDAARKGHGAWVFIVLAATTTLGTYWGLEERRSTLAHSRHGGLT
jgi:hypothetical protein